MGTLEIYDFSPIIYSAGWSSLVARRAHNPKVASSNLAPATIERTESDRPERAGHSFFTEAIFLLLRRQHPQDSLGSLTVFEEWRILATG